VNPKQKLMVVIPIIAALVIVLIYFGLFTNPLVIAAIFVLYIVVSLRNRRKFKKQEQEK
jgi:predicted membrane protein